MTQSRSFIAPLLKRDTSQEVPDERLRIAPAVACVLQIVLAYEWLVSGLDKIADQHFNSQLVSVLQQSTQNSRYGWYAFLLHQFVLPNHTVFALLIQVTEPALGAALLLGGGLGLLRPGSLLAVYGGLGASAALLGSAFLSLNYFFQGNCLIPWIDPNNSFGPGLNVNILIALISLVLLLTNLRPLIRTRAGHRP